MSRVRMLKIYLNSIAEAETHRERCQEPDGFFNPMDASGGNFDDAYEMGREDGEVETARRILRMLEDES